MAVDIYMHYAFRTEVRLRLVDLHSVKIDESKPDFRPEGIVHVYVNGHPVLQEGSYCGGRAGKVVLKK